MIRVVLPTHLGRLANTPREISISVEGPVTIEAVIDALEKHYPALRGTIRDHQTRERRAFIRFFACGEDLSHQPVNLPLPERVIDGSEPLRIVGAMAGG